MNDSYADLIVLALIAVFVLLRLRNNLGKQIGFDPREKTESRDSLRRSLNADATARAEGIDPAGLPGPLRSAIDPQLEAMEAGAVKTSLEAMRLLEPSLTVKSFLEGAKGAFEWVFNAFHKGDRATLKSLLSPEVYAEFEAAIAAREESKLSSHGTLVAITEATITEAVLDKRLARITVHFLSEQIQMSKDSGGAVIEGSPGAIHHVEDEWTFERELGARSPNWTVSAT